MKTVIRILIAVLLVAAAVLSLTGCKKNTQQQNKTTAASAETDSSSTKAPAGETAETTENEEVNTESRVFVVDTKQREVKMRKNPSADAGEVQEIPQGAEVEVEEESDGWMKIRFEDKTGWVKSENITEVTKAEKVTEPSAAGKTAETTRVKTADKPMSSAADTTTAKNTTAKATAADTTTAKSTTAKATASDATTAKNTTAKSTTAKASSTGAATSKATTTKKADASTSTAKDTTKSTTANTGSQKAATVHIRLHGRKSGDKEITAKVKPGESYTGSMAYKAVSNKFPGESVRIEGDSIINYDPASGIKDYYFDVYFNEALEITAED